MGAIGKNSLVCLPIGGGLDSLVGTTLLAMYLLEFLHMNPYMRRRDLYARYSTTPSKSMQ